MFLDFITIAICKLSYKLLELFNKQGGNLPGLIALKINKKILSRFKITGKIIAVTGTNGKTSTTNLISSILENNNRVLCNNSGNNLNTGVASLLIKNCTFTGKVDCDYLVLEVDEHYIPIVFRQLKLDSLVILNFFRDQLDRTGEVEKLICKISKFLETYNGNLILNANDPNVVRLANSNTDNTNVYYYGVDKYEGSKRKIQDKGEGKFCPVCTTRLKYSYYHYSHIGKFICPECGFGDNEIKCFATNINLKEKTFTCFDKEFKTKYDSIYNIYNVSAALTISKIYGVSYKTSYNTIKDFELNKGRFEKLIINNNETIMNLAKNPTGANVTIKIMNRDEDRKELLFVLNDNVADGKDVSWIWDINFNVLNKVDRVITSGTRAYDMAVRIKNSGFNYKKIECYPYIEEAVNNLYKTDSKKYIIFNYTAVNETRMSIIKYKEKEDKNDI